MSGLCVKVVLYARVIKKINGFSQVMGVYSVFVGFVTQLCSPSNVCGAWTHVCIH